MHKPDLKPMNKITVKCFVAAFMGILAGNSNVSAAGMTLNADDGIALANGPIVWKNIRRRCQIR